MDESQVVKLPLLTCFFGSLIFHGFPTGYNHKGWPLFARVTEGLLGREMLGLEGAADEIRWCLFHCLGLLGEWC